MTWVLHWPVLIIDAKATEHILHLHGIGKMTHIDVAHLWLQDGVKSNRLRVRWVRSADILLDIGTKAISNKIIRKHATSMGYVDAPENLKDRGIRASRSEQFIQLSRKRRWSQLVAMPDSSSNISSSNISSSVVTESRP